MSLAETISKSSNFVAHMQSRNLRLQKANYMFSKGKTVDVLRSSIMDEASTHDFLKILLEQPDSITLDVAVEVMTNTTLLAKSKHTSHIKIASLASKFVLTHFGEMIRANQEKSAFPTLNQEERGEKCDLIKKMGFQIRQNLKQNKFRIADSQFADTIREMDVMLKEMKI
jgi:hypothetical protein